MARRKRVVQTNAPRADEGLVGAARSQVHRVVKAVEPIARQNIAKGLHAVEKASQHTREQLAPREEVNKHISKETDQSLSSTSGDNTPESGAIHALKTVVFDTEEEYVRFTDYVYDTFAGRGIELTNVPISTSIRIRPWLLEQTQERFGMHEATEEEVERVQADLRTLGRKPFEPESLKAFRVPGVHRAVLGPRCYASWVGS